MVTLPKTCDAIAHPRLPVQDRNGASFCYNCIIEAFQAKGYNVACRMMRDWALAEDVLQESFVSGYRAFSQFRGDNLNAWMMRIIANTCRDFLRSRLARPIISLDPLPTAADDSTPSAVDLPPREESPEESPEELLEEPPEEAPDMPPGMPPEEPPDELLELPRVPMLTAQPPVSASAVMTAALTVSLRMVEIDNCLDERLSR